MYDTSVRHTNNATAGGISATGLGKRYGDLWALRGLDLEVAPGEVLGLLGHNGAGKTTAIRILTTLALPSEGSATVAGFDVVEGAGSVRARIGVAAQQATVDDLLNAGKNLEMVGRLHHMSKAAARARANELLERLDLTDATDRLVKTFSGGMRRRLDLAASIMADPEVLFLDEPTTGLDPRSRNDLWQMLRELANEGTTIVLTTQYLEEADRLADDIVVLDHGQAIARGRPEELKRHIGGERLEVAVVDRSDLDPVTSILKGVGTGEPTVDTETRRITVPVAGGVKALTEAVRQLDAAEIQVADIGVRRPTLDDVFLQLTGHAATDDEANGKGKKA
jgi:ABC-2 type transport system ATP-binding protein